MSSDLVRRVLDFWFAERDEGGALLARQAWFKKDEAFDQAIRDAFADDIEAAAAGGLDHLADTAEGALALMILLDQFPRNVFRGTPRAFAADPKAREIARAALDQGFDQAVPAVARTFFYLPFEHSEDLADQERAVALFQATGDAELVRWAVLHRDIIARFGRFPHRNAVLGRTSTAAEEEFLKQPNSSF
jgi:uncharacterized protein (DUF924 family)